MASLLSNFESRISSVLNSNNLEMVFATIGGSRRFGYALDVSDCDIRLVGMPSKNYYLPNMRNCIMGFDQIAAPAYSGIVNAFYTDDTGLRTKGDIFHDVFTAYMQKVVGGGYFQLHNLLSPLDKDSTWDKRWPEFRQSLITNLPDMAYYMSSMFLVRDIKAYQLRLDNGQAKAEEISKKTTQLVFIANFLKNRDPSDKSEDYPTMRRSTLSSQEAGKILQIAVEGLSTLTLSKPDAAEISRQKTFKTAMLSGINAWYGEEIFPL